eukprot:4224962-Amphidinium_carterae.1
MARVCEDYEDAHGQHHLEPALRERPLEAVKFVAIEKVLTALTVRMPLGHVSQGMVKTPSAPW